MWRILHVCFIMSAVGANSTFQHQLKVKYFSDISMLCDHQDLNLERQTDVRSIAWILPDGAILDSDHPPSSQRLHLSGPSDRLDVYNLTAVSVDDPDFGYYTCVVTYQSAGKSLTVVKWALNVDGADFSELMETFRHNALIGGIAAAAVLVGVGGACILWHYRFEKRTQPEGQLQKEVPTAITSHASDYSNQSFSLQDEVIEVKVT